MQALVVVFGHLVGFVVRNGAGCPLLALERLDSPRAHPFRQLRHARNLAHVETLQSRLAPQCAQEGPRAVPVVV
eukprot:scaffold3038_cov69-Phaeocystis_antarctica.AAC.4